MWHVLTSQPMRVWLLLAANVVIIACLFRQVCKQDRDIP